MWLLPLRVILNASYIHVKVCQVLNMKHNSREKARDAVLIIKMEGNNTYIKDPSSPEQEPKKYTFDHSYWSHDGFKEREDGYLEPANHTYADQVKFLNIINTIMMMLMMMMMIIIIIIITFPPT